MSHFEKRMKNMLKIDKLRWNNFLLQDNYFYCKVHEKNFKKHLYNIYPLMYDHVVFVRIKITEISIEYNKRPEHVAISIGYVKKVYGRANL